MAQSYEEHNTELQQHRRTGSAKGNENSLHYLQLGLVAQGMGETDTWERPWSDFCIEDNIVKLPKMDLPKNLNFSLVFVQSLTKLQTNVVILESANT